MPRGNDEHLWPGHVKDRELCGNVRLLIMMYIVTKVTREES